jgi:hypothetical protein
MDGAGCGIEQSRGEHSILRVTFEVGASLIIERAPVGGGSSARVPLAKLDAKAKVLK